MQVAKLQNLRPHWTVARFALFPCPSAADIVSCTKTRSTGLAPAMKESLARETLGRKGAAWTIGICSNHVEGGDRVYQSRCSQSCRGRRWVGRLDCRLAPGTTG